MKRFQHSIVGDSDRNERKKKRKDQGDVDDKNHWLMSAMSKCKIFIYKYSRGDASYHN